MGDSDTFLSHRLAFCFRTYIALDSDPYNKDYIPSSFQDGATSNRY